VSLLHLKGFYETVSLRLIFLTDSSYVYGPNVKYGTVITQKVINIVYIFSFNNHFRKRKYVMIAVPYLPAKTIIGPN
jgi:hypothetical protein